jgi:hypothetical protein
MLIPSKPFKPKMPSIQISVTGVMKQLKLTAQPTKACGPDNISPRVLKELHQAIAPILADIFATPLVEGNIPTDWRNVSVSPVFKKGSRTNPSNYMPISLTCICCKIMEHILVSNIMTFLDNNNLLYQNQHGFRSKLSCEILFIQLVQGLQEHNKLE